MWDSSSVPSRKASTRLLMDLKIRKNRRGACQTTKPRPMVELGRVGIPGSIILSDLAASNPTFTAPVVTDTTNFEFVLVVNDGDPNSADSEPDTVTVTVHDNQAPVAYFTFSNEKQPGVIVEGEEVTLDWNFTEDETKYDTTHSYDVNNDLLSI